MKRIKVLWLLIPVVLFGALWRVNEYRRSSPVILSRYPQLYGRVTELMNPTDNDNVASPRDNALLRIHVFDTNYGEEVVWLRDTGVIRPEYFLSGRIQLCNGGRLNSTQLQIVKRALNELPSNHNAPKFGDLLLVSFKRDEQWETRVYSRANRPEPVQVIFNQLQRFDFEPLKQSY